MPQDDQETAGGRLAGHLACCALDAPLILALTPESVPVARDLARRLGGEVDRIFVEGMDVPAATSRCSGAVSETGHLVLASESPEPPELQAAIAKRMLDHIVRLVARRAAAKAGAGLKDSSGRNVILVADGLAGGATMIAAIRGVRSQHPLRLVAAIGIATPRTIDRIREEADETIALSTVAQFGDVGRVRRSRNRAVLELAR